jgi:uncharacterized damage-inducible protein DinB
MNADAFRYLYDYHFSENRKIWNAFVMPLSDEQFTQHVDYSVGSVRNQIVHMISCDNTWFTELRGLVPPDFLNPDEFTDRGKLRAHWDALEQDMRGYLAKLRDDMLFTKPIPFEEDKDLIVWQVLLHVVNHGTDHRAQLLRLLNDLGVKTGPQDFIFHVYDHP